MKTANADLLARLERALRAGQGSRASRRRAHALWRTAQGRGLLRAGLPQHASYPLIAKMVGKGAKLEPSS